MNSGSRTGEFLWRTHSCVPRRHSCRRLEFTDEQTLSLLVVSALLLTAQSNLERRGVVREGRARKVSAQDVPRGFALIIGVSKYPKLDAQNNKLLFPEKDAEAIQDALISQEGGNFSPQNVHLLTGPNATLQNIRRELDWLTREAHDGDRVIIYFAGHGFWITARISGARGMDPCAHH